jgi:hypothetical protein
MKKIQVIQTFKDDGQTFIKDEQRFVTPEKAGYYCGLGWAKDIAGEIPLAEPDTSPKTLDVHDGGHTTDSPDVTG